MYWRRMLNTNMVLCTVLPRPISSASMELRRFTQFHSIQLMPSIW